MKTDNFVKLLLKVIPNKVIRHYIYPFIVGREKKGYDAEAYFNSWYKSLNPEDFTDANTISHNPDFRVVSAHYATVENSIKNFFFKNSIPENLTVLDIGSGAGHWIDFYLENYAASKIYALEISEEAVKRLKEKYSSNAKVVILKGDISSPDFHLPEKVNVVNAIGVMFHIVDDRKWEQALTNISSVLPDTGYFLCTDQFGLISKAVQFHNTDYYVKPDQVTSYTSVKQILASTRQQVLINKKIRSLKKWKKETLKIGLNFRQLITARENKLLLTPENNLGVWQKIESAFNRDSKKNI